MKNILGCDIGNVIVGHDTDNNAFNNSNLEKPPIDSAFESLKECVTIFDHVYIVSKCGERRQAGTLAWLKHHNFYERTGVLEEDVLFCRKRKDKATICTSLGITHFIDDRLEILAYIWGANPIAKLYLFNSSLKELTRWADAMPNTWHKFFEWPKLLQQMKCDV